jgi:hypothetical protein
MKSKIDDFIETLTEDEVSQLMNKISKRVLIPKYYTKEEIKNMFEEHFADSEFLKRMQKELNISSQNKNYDVELSNSIFASLIEDFNCHEVLDETIFNLIQGFVYMNEFDEKHYEIIYSEDKKNFVYKLE